MYSIFPAKVSEMNGFLKKPEPYDNFESIAYGFCYYLKIIPLFVYIYANTHNIDFKGWMIDIMKGLKQEYSKIL